MGLRVQMLNQARNMFGLPSLSATEIVPKGHLAVYVGENRDKSRFVVPISYLNHPLFRELLRSSEEEYGFDYPLGGLTIPCSENEFKDVTSYLMHSNKGEFFHVVYQVLEFQGES